MVFCQLRERCQLCKDVEKLQKCNGWHPHWGRGQEAVCRLLVLFCLLIQSVRSLRACLLMFSASPATAAMEICCVWWTTKEEALADAVPYTVRPVRGLVPTASLANTWRNCLVGGAMPPKVSTSTSRVMAQQEKNPSEKKERKQTPQGRDGRQPGEVEGQI